MTQKITAQPIEDCAVGEKTNSNDYFTTSLATFTVPSE